MIIGENSVWGLLAKRVGETPDRPFVEFNEVKLSYKQFFEKVESLARGLYLRGISKGGFVAVKLENSIEFLEIWFALQRLGAVLVPINPNLANDESNYILEHSEAKLFISSSKEIKEIEEGGVEGLPDFDISYEDLSAVLYTSGTTGKPKGVMLPQRSFLVGAESFAYRAGLTESDRIMLILPMFHVNALVYSCLGAVVSGATIVIKKSFSSSTFWKDIVENQITQFNFLGVIANILLRQEVCSYEKQHNLRLVCGAGLSSETINNFESRFGVKIIETYGLTECPMGTSNLLDRRKVGTIGLPSVHPNSSFNNKVEIVDEEKVILGVNEVGEIRLESKALALGYLKDLDSTKEVFEFPFFFTGDYGKKDEQGYFYFVDRKKDIIRRKGENISSKEIEDIILSSNMVEVVAAFAVKNSLGSEDIAVMFVPKELENFSIYELFLFCSNNLSKFKIPNLYIPVNELPRTSTNKLAKNKIKEEVNLRRKRLFEQKSFFVERKYSDFSSLKKDFFEFCNEYLILPDDYTLCVESDIGSDEISSILEIPLKRIVRLDKTKINELKLATCFRLVVAKKNLKLSFNYV